MQYNSFLGNKVSRLGFGAMRFPNKEDGTPDSEQIQKMIDCAYESGVNYFDTALVYGMGSSEKELTKALAKYPRESYYLTDKFPAHTLEESFDAPAIFEQELANCSTDYFDYYLLHNVYEKSIDNYMDPRWNILPYLIEQRNAGRIRHLGLSTHARTETLIRFLDYCDSIEPGCMEFCQIQCNYSDWYLQDSGGKYQLLTDRGIEVVIMEPLHGGAFAKLSDEAEAKLQACRPGESTASWSFRWLQAFPNMKVILSGMSAPEQVKDNIRTFSEGEPLTPAERELIEGIAREMRNDVPCTACRYCAKVCPQGLDIPLLLHAYNEMRVTPTMTTGMLLEFLPEGRKPSDCQACGKCTRMCPQNIDIPTHLADLLECMKKVPSWTAVCEARKASQK